MRDESRGENCPDLRQLAAAPPLTHLSSHVALQGPFSGLFVAFPIPRAALRRVMAVAVRLCAPVVPNADRTPLL